MEKEYRTLETFFHAHLYETNEVKLEKKERP